MKALFALVCTGALVACSKTETETPPLPVAHEPTLPAPSHSAVALAAPSAPSSGHGKHHHPKVVLEEIAVPSSPSTVNVKWKIPSGTAVNDEAPFNIRWKSSEALENAPDDVAAKGQGHNEGFRIALRPAKGAKEARLLGEIELVVCDAESHSICIPVKREVELSFTVGGGAAPKPVELPLPAAKG